MYYRLFIYQRGEGDPVGCLDFDNNENARLVFETLSRIAWDGSERIDSVTAWRMYPDENKSEPIADVI